MTSSSRELVQRLQGLRELFNTRINTLIEDVRDEEIEEMNVSEELGRIVSEITQNLDKTI